MQGEISSEQLRVEPPDFPVQVDKVPDQLRLHNESSYLRTLPVATTSKITLDNEAILHFCSLSEIKSRINKQQVKLNS